MKLLFAIENGIYLQNPKGPQIDVHNNMTVENLSMDFRKKSIRILMRRSDNSAARETATPDRLTIAFDEVTYFNVFTPTLPQTEGCIDEMGFKSIEDLNLDWLNAEQDSTGESHLIFRFVDDSFIRIGAKSGRIEIP